MTDLADRRDIETAVYQPAEDSRLLARTAAGELAAGDRVLEVGVGSGWVAERLAAVGGDVVGSDVNPHACRAAADRGVPVVRANLMDPFRADAFDLVCCNPPYLPRDERAARDDWMERALSGGEHGRAVVEPFLADLSRVLAPGGVGVLLVSTLTDVDAVTDAAAAAGLDATTLAAESHPFETLVVLGLRHAGRA
ncbi:MAG: HemK2/MTQ2 family protein methyltransferase [Halobacteriaceae archaeon]